MTHDAGKLVISRREGGLAITLHVTPRARQPKVGGHHDGALRVAVREPPVDGAANAACVRALAVALGIPARDVELDPGATGRRKRVRVAGDPDALQCRLDELAGLAGGSRSQ